MKSYTLKEVSKKINTAPGIIRQWEKELTGILHISRSKQGARIYTDVEINQLTEVKELFAKKIGKEAVRDALLKQSIANHDTEPEETAADADSEFISPPEPVTFEMVTHINKQPSIPDNENSLSNADLFFEVMDAYKKNFLNEVKEEIRSVVRKEVLTEVKKEISNGTLRTVKSVQDSIYKSSENTKEQIQELSETISKASEETSDKLRYLSSNIKNVTIETADEVYSLTKQVVETSDKLSNYIDQTNNEISNLADEIAKEREFLMDDREQYRHEVQQREAAFQQMLANYREVAAAKEKKWWKFWS